MTYPFDSFTGTLLALEGICDAVVVLNGPTGCSFYHAFLSHNQVVRSSPAPTSIISPGQGRIPSTGLDGADYINGSLQKNRGILTVLAADHKGLIVIVNSPGAALIGDDLGREIISAGIEDRCFVIESVPPSGPAPEGFADASVQVLQHLALKSEDRDHNKVNLLGISLLHKYWEGDVTELTRLLTLMNIETGAVLLADTSTDELQRSVSAACNIIVCSEYGRMPAQWFQSEFGIPFIENPDGAPIGFDATEAWVEKIAENNGTDPEPALRDIRVARDRAYNLLMQAGTYSGNIRGTTFAIRADSSIVLPLTKWLLLYLGMVPVGVMTLPGGNPSYEAALEEFLNSHGFGEAWQSFPGRETADIVFADGHNGELLVREGRCRSCIEIGLPSEDHRSFVPRSIMGTNGAMHLLDEIMKKSGATTR